MAGGVGVSSAFAGCGNLGGEYNDIQILLDLREIVKRPDTEGDFDLTVDVELGFSDTPSIDDVVLLGYDNDDRRVARHPVGTLEVNDSPVEVTTVSSGFPAIIMATTATSACEELITEVVYLSSPITPAYSRTWEDTFRECGDDLPPERLRETTGSPSQNGR